ncbi:hypothetical protein RJ639_015335 [Escallonia herrerae]|uniref:Reverse transcriptase/retrotransposon-derived protein RNase H-like domain-containing protein n=1 Tax=Escallonia herrerae TaxID=1293975 RepID=A0AA88VJC2_9ASTE|nr:hypothetical protein RJ639_015335 [Escallonia herrerae]
MEEPVLALPDHTNLFEVQTDASNFVIRGVLMQEGHPMAFERYKLNDTKRRLFITSFYRQAGAVIGRHHHSLVTIRQHRLNQQHGCNFAVQGPKVAPQHCPSAAVLRRLTVVLRIAEQSHQRQSGSPIRDTQRHSERPTTRGPSNRRLCSHHS